MTEQEKQRRIQRIDVLTAELQELLAPVDGPEHFPRDHEREYEENEANWQSEKSAEVSRSLMHAAQRWDAYGCILCRGHPKRGERK